LEKALKLANFFGGRAQVIFVTQGAAAGCGDVEFGVCAKV
jgi:hypothetical protein